MGELGVGRSHEQAAAIRDRRTMELGPLGTGGAQKERDLATGIGPRPQMSKNIGNRPARRRLMDEAFFEIKWEFGPERKDI